MPARMYGRCFDSSFRSASRLRTIEKIPVSGLRRKMRRGEPAGGTTAASTAVVAGGHIRYHVTKTLRGCGMNVAAQKQVCLCLFRLATPVKLDIPLDL
jgi:hypothetical protein